MWSAVNWRMDVSVFPRGTTVSDPEKFIMTPDHTAQSLASHGPCAACQKQFASPSSYLVAGSLRGSCLLFTGSHVNTCRWLLFLLQSCKMLGALGSSRHAASNSHYWVTFDHLQLCGSSWYFFQISTFFWYNNKTEWGVSMAKLLSRLLLKNRIM